MRINKVIFTILIGLVLFSGELKAREPGPGEQSLSKVLLSSVSRRDRRRAGRLSAPAYLYITADPKWAKIYIDGKLAGTGTAMLTKTTGSPFVRVKLIAPNRMSLSGWIKLKPKKVVKLLAELPRKGGDLTLLTSPAGANVMVDSVDSGTTPITIEALEPGPHMVELRSGEWQWKARLMVREGKTSVISMDIPEMVTAPPAPPAPPAPAPVAAPPASPRPAPAAVQPPPAPAPKPVAAVAPPPPPRPQKKVDLGKKKPDCNKICNHYVAASGASQTVQDMLKQPCMERCNKLDMRFSICAWKAKNMADVQKCADLPPQ